MLAGEQDFQRTNEIAASRTLGSSDRCGEFLLKGLDQRNRLLGRRAAVSGQAELHRAWISRMFGPHDQASRFERAGELGDEDWLEAGPVGELALARLDPGLREAV